MSTITEHTSYDELALMAERGELKPLPNSTGGPTNINSEEELVALFKAAGRNTLGRSESAGASARRQVRLPETLNTALDEYAATHKLTPSEVIRQALDSFLTPAA